MTIFRTYAKGDPELVREVPRNLSLVVVDPGARGVALGWLDGLARWPRAPDWRRSISSRGSGHRDLARQALYADVDVVIVEDQFIAPTLGVRSQIELIRNAGMAVGQILYAVQPEHVVWVPPAHWQIVLPKARGLDTKERARRLAGRLVGARWLAEQGPSPIQEACADVLAMAHWFEGVSRETRASEHGF